MVHGSSTQTSTVYSTEVPRTGCTDGIEATATTTTASATCPPAAEPTDEIGLEIINIGVIPSSDMDVDPDVNTDTDTDTDDMVTKDAVDSSGEATQASQRLEHLPYPLLPRDSEMQQVDAPFDYIYFRAMLIFPRDPFDSFDISLHLAAFRFTSLLDQQVHSLSYTTIEAPSHNYFTAAFHLEFYTQRLREELNADPLASKVGTDFSAGAVSVVVLPLTFAF